VRGPEIAAHRRLKSTRRVNARWPAGMVAFFAGNIEARAAIDFLLARGGVKHTDAAKRIRAYKNVSQNGAGAYEYLIVRYLGTGARRELGDAWQASCRKDIGARVLCGQYRLVRSQSTDRRSRSRARGILTVFTERRPDIPEEAFENWYNAVHVPEILATGWYHAAYRYVRVSGTLAEYLAVYETEKEPARAATELLKYRDKWSLPSEYGNPTEVKVREAFTKAAVGQIRKAGNVVA
jgi:hypothetical protein